MLPSLLSSSPTFFHRPSFVRQLSVTLAASRSPAAFVTRTLFAAGIAFAAALVPDSVIRADERPTPPDATEAVRDQIRQATQSQQATQKQLALKKASLEVAQGRVAEIQKTLDEAVRRVSAEQADLTRLDSEIKSHESQIAALQEQLKQHEAADQLQQVAAAAAGRMDAIIAARLRLETELATLRKSSVEFQSRAVESEQQVAALEAQRADIQKAIDAAKTAKDTADQQLTAANTALAAADQTLDTQTKALAAEQQRLDTATVASQKLGESIKALQKSLEGLKEAAKVMGVSPEDAVNGLTGAITDLLPLQKNADTIVQQATARRDAMVPPTDAAKADQQKKQAEQTAMADAAKKAGDAHQQAADRLTALDTQQNSLRSVIAESQAQQKTLAAQMLGLEPSVEKLAAEIQLIRAEVVEQQKLAQSALEPLGRFVSFSHNVAPILAKHCIACHNTRSPGGRLNLDSFAALMKGGESGAAFEAHKSADSLLVMMVEDGSMPKEADPLTAEEIAVIRRWIDVGSPLDAGLLASAELFDVIPEAAQPLPPDSYRVPIPITATAFSPDGGLLATSGYHEVLIWKTDDGSLLRRIVNVAERVYDIEFSQDGKSLAVAAGTPGQLGEVKVFAAADGSLQQTLVRARDAIFAVSYSPEGTRLASAGADRSIVVVDVQNGNILTKIEDHADWVMDVNWSPDGLRLVSSSRDKTSKVFDAKSGDPQITFSGHGEPVYSAAFLSDNKTVVSGGSDKKLRLWTIADAKEVRSIGGFGGDVFRIVITAGDHILTACADRSAREHNAADGKALRTLSGHADWVYTLAFSTARELIATGSYDGEIRVWNSKDGSMQTSFIAVPKDMPAGTATASAQ